MIHRHSEGEYPVGPEEEALELLLDEERDAVDTIMRESSYRDMYYDSWDAPSVSIRGERVA